MPAVFILVSCVSLLSKIYRRKQKDLRHFAILKCQIEYCCETVYEEVLSEELIYKRLILKMREVFHSIHLLTQTLGYSLESFDCTCVGDLLDSLALMQELKGSAQALTL